MEKSDEKSHFDVYQRLLDSGEMDTYLPTIEQMLNRSQYQIPSGQLEDDRTLWYLLRFRGDGTIHSFHHAGHDLEQVLSSEKDWSFEIMVRIWGKEARLTANDVRIFNEAWNIPEYLWSTMLAQRYVWTLSIDTDSEKYGIISTQSRTFSIQNDHLYLPEADAGHGRSAVIFMHYENFDSVNWSVNPATSAISRINSSSYDTCPLVKPGEHGMVLWFTEQAYQRQCTSQKDFVFLCAEAIIRTNIMRVSSQIRYLHEESSADRMKQWLTLWTRNAASLNAIQNLSGWIQDHCSLPNDRDLGEHRMTILRQYEHKIRCQERLVTMLRHSSDLGFAVTGNKMAEESINEVKFSKILTTVAIIYLPVSIASSIFGMNVQELNGQGVRLVWFGVTIMAVFAALLLCLLLFAILTNKRDAVKAIWAERLRVSTYAPRTWQPRLWFVGLSRQRIANWPKRMGWTCVELWHKLRGILRRRSRGVRKEWQLC